jgi:uncharacterized membrane protein YqhA
MSKLKIKLAALIFYVSIIHIWSTYRQINSNRPGVNMSAFAVGKSVIQVETGVYGIKET